VILKLLCLNKCQGCRCRWVALVLKRSRFVAFSRGGILIIN
jgi:hypothetical protein